MNTQDMMNIISGAFSKYGAGDISQVGYDNYFQELSKRIIAYEIQTSWYWIYGAIAIIILSLLALAVCYIKRKEWNDSDIIAVCVCSVAAIAIGITVIIIQANDIATCRNFPEKIVWEYIRDTLKNLLNTTD